MSIVARGLGLPESLLVAAGLGRAGVAEVLAGDATLDQWPSDVTAVGYASAKAQPAASAGGGNFSRGAQPHPLQLVEAIRRDRAMDALGLRLVGEVSAEQPCPAVAADGRIKRVSLVASSASAEVSPGELGQATGEFIDVELEMAAMALALMQRAA